MSVMLKTTNPDAVNEMDPARDRRVPHQGQVLVYHMRPGEGRGGKITAPGIVTQVEDDDHVELMIVHAADDFITRWKIPRKTEQNPVNAWSFTEDDERHYQPNAKADAPQVTAADFGSLRSEVETLRAKIVSLEAELRNQRNNQQRR